jgi:hypothetical protein
LRTVIDLFLALRPPAMLLGDLNTTRDDPLLRDLLATPSVADALANSPAGSGRIDWIITHGLKTVASGMSPAGASDHPQFWADLQLNSGEFEIRDGEWEMRSRERAARR